MTSDDRPLAVGDDVVVVGLKSESARGLNGRVGHVAEAAAEDGRAAVQLIACPTIDVGALPAIRAAPDELAATRIRPRTDCILRADDAASIARWLGDDQDSERPESIDALALHCCAALLIAPPRATAVPGWRVRLGLVEAMLGEPSLRQHVLRGPCLGALGASLVHAHELALSAHAAQHTACLATVLPAALPLWSDALMPALGVRAGAAGGRKPLRTPTRPTHLTHAVITAGGVPLLEALVAIAAQPVILTYLLQAEGADGTSKHGSYGADALLAMIVYVISAPGGPASELASEAEAATALHANTRALAKAGALGLTLALAAHAACPDGVRILRDGAGASATLTGSIWAGVRHQAQELLVQLVVRSRKSPLDVAARALERVRLPRQLLPARVASAAAAGADGESLLELLVSTLREDGAHLSADVRSALPTLKSFAEVSGLLPMGGQHADSDVQVMTRMRDICAACGKMSDVGVHFARCARCAAQPYCSAECQKADWQAHKEVCKEVARARGVTGGGHAPRGHPPMVKTVNTWLFSHSHLILLAPFKPGGEHINVARSVLVLDFTRPGTGTDEPPAWRFVPEAEWEAAVLTAREGKPLMCESSRAELWPLLRTCLAKRTAKPPSTNLELVWMAGFAKGVGASGETTLNPPVTESGERRGWPWVMEAVLSGHQLGRQVHSDRGMTALAFGSIFEAMMSQRASAAEAVPRPPVPSWATMFGSPGRGR